MSVSGSPDYILHGGDIQTLESSIPATEAVAITGQSISALGKDDVILALKNRSTLSIDLRERSVLPAFRDAHIHLDLWGLTMAGIDLRPPTVISVRDIVQTVRRKADRAPRGSWIVGFGYDETKFEEQKHPTRHDLDLASSAHPILIHRTCFHAAVANTVALDEAGVSALTPNPEGGEIARNPATGDLTGLLKETAVGLATRAQGPPSKNDLVQALQRGAREAVARGIAHATIPTADDQLDAKAASEALLVAASDPAFPIEITVMTNALSDSFWRELEMNSMLPPRVSLGGAKLFLDGGIGARTAAMTHPYMGMKNSQGSFRMQPQEIRDVVNKLHRAGRQVAAHAIRDAAIEAYVAVVEHAQATYHRGDHRHRGEHCGVCPAPLQERMAKAGLVACIQPLFIPQMGKAFEEALHPTLRPWLYPWRSLRSSGVVVAAGSDVPVVADPNPLDSISAAMYRRTPEGEVITPTETASLRQAIAMHTIGAAFADIAEERCGRLTPGLQADLVVLSGGLGNRFQDTVARLRVDLCIVSGDVVFDRHGEAQR